jgi:hypothetical protein
MLAQNIAFLSLLIFEWGKNNLPRHRLICLSQFKQV